MLWFLEWNDLFCLNLRRGVVFRHLQILHHIWENYCLVSSIFQLHCTLFTTTFIPFSFLSRLLKFAKNDIFGKKRWGGGMDPLPPINLNDLLLIGLYIWLSPPRSGGQQIIFISVYKSSYFQLIEKKSIISYVNTHFPNCVILAKFDFFFKVRRMWSLVKLFQSALPHGFLFWKWCCLF